MQLTLKIIDQAAATIQAKIDSGELIAGCGMSAVQTPTREAWDVAEDITAQGKLSEADQKTILSGLNEKTRRQLEDIKHDDFDLVYEYFLQQISNSPS